MRVISTDGLDVDRSTACENLKNIMKHSSLWSLLFFSSSSKTKIEYIRESLAKGTLITTLYKLCTDRNPSVRFWATWTFGLFADYSEDFTLNMVILTFTQQGEFKDRILEKDVVNKLMTLMENPKELIGVTTSCSIVIGMLLKDGEYLF